MEKRYKKKKKRWPFIGIVIAVLAVATVLAVGICICLSRRKPAASNSGKHIAISENQKKASRRKAAWQEKSGNKPTKTKSKAKAKAKARTKKAKKTIKGFVAIDPGHQGSGVDMSAQEPNAPGSSTMKTKATAGTQGTYTGISEYQLNLDISLMLKKRLKKRGYKVIMTREDNDKAISNAERAVLANDSGADFLIRIHANGSENANDHGALALVPGADNPYVGNLSAQSRELAQDVLDSYCSATGLSNQGILDNNTMTGINWSKIPVFILEMGFMTNQSDDTNMADPEFRKKMVQGIVDGIESYYLRHLSDVSQAADGQDGQGGQLQAVVNNINSEYLAARRDRGEKWAVCIRSLADDKSASVNGDIAMQSASVIKMFIMAAVYDRVCYPSSGDKAIHFSEKYDGELRALIDKMITVSDNDAANTIVERLGGGNFAAGMEVVNTYCAQNGYSKTSMGRRFLGSTLNGDNYTSVNDTASLMAAIYHGTCVNAEASAKMLDFLKRQTKRNKIPAGIAAYGVVTANKTGELSGDGLGYVENDACIVWGGHTDYILCIFSGALTDGNASAISNITEISGAVYNALEK